MKKYTLIILTIASLFTACNKKSKSVYTIEGRLFWDCNLEPIREAAIDLWRSPVKTGIIAQTTTDSEGYFTFTYEQTNSVIQLSIRTGTTISTDILEWMPPNTDLQLDSVYYSEVVSLMVYLNANQNYTDSDTLYVNVPFSDAGDGTINSHFTDTFTGPFYTGFLKEYIVNKNQNWYQTFESRRITWYLNKYIKEEAKEYDFKIFGCNQSDSVSITIP